MRDRAPLREFVYLDEVSVYSLIASRRGPVAKEFTETETTTLQGEAVVTLGAAVPGIGKGEGSSRLLGSQARGSQVLRKSIVQATFKELYEIESSSMVLRPVPDDEDPPCKRNLTELERSCDDTGENPWTLDPRVLQRGCLLEVEAELEAEAIFQMSSVISSFVDVLDESPELFGEDAYRNVAQARSLDRILSKLLVGLVPIRGRLLEYEVVDVAGKEWMVHRRLLDQLLADQRPPTVPLRLVGVAEESLFWKDIRRVLFSNARFRVLCRLAVDGIQDSWTPIKLTEVLRSVAPEVADQLNAAGSGALEAISGRTSPAEREAAQRQMMHAALVAYGQMFGAHYDHVITERDLAEADLLSEKQCTSYGSLQDRRAAFDKVALHVLERFHIERDSLVVAQYRAAALCDAGMDLMGQVMPAASHGLEPSPRAEQDERFLDVEFIAIYW